MESSNWNPAFCKMVVSGLPGLGWLDWKTDPTWNMDSFIVGLMSSIYTMLIYMYIIFMNEISIYNSYIYIICIDMSQMVHLSKKKRSMKKQRLFHVASHNDVSFQRNPHHFRPSANLKRNWTQKKCRAHDRFMAKTRWLFICKTLRLQTKWAVSSWPYLFAVDMGMNI